MVTTDRSTDSISPKVANLLSAWNLDDDISLGGSQLENQYRKYSDERGFRKKSREKLRRQELNQKVKSRISFLNLQFDVLVDVLGFTNRVRKHVILQEAVSTIEILKWERNKLFMDRERLQQEVNTLVTFQQESAANGNSLIPLPNRPSLDGDPSVM
ncbi:hypothetical protein PHMEG_00018672 [Phytophthora megakarya]|uniref:BHLH domain-containing protein n=1 Tax=Phytophthora megakarya TaxID=4795 RepID=A0A225VTH1_9STRA|nr:hypothetical protein PHMEG_00018672 [Phytophthora megakarya]